MDQHSISQILFSNLSHRLLQQWQQWHGKSMVLFPRVLIPALVWCDALG